MRLSEYPSVVVRLSCAKCGREGRYRLARLAERYGAEIELPWLLDKLATGCRRRANVNAHIYDPCGARFATDEPPPPATPALRVVR